MDRLIVSFSTARGHESQSHVHTIEPLRNDIADEGTDPTSLLSRDALRPRAVLANIVGRQRLVFFRRSQYLLSIRGRAAATGLSSTLEDKVPEAGM
jgi:hypothetical protein